MALRKPFRAVPVKLGPRYRRAEKARLRHSVFKQLGIAALLGAVVGIGSIGVTESGRNQLLLTIKPAMIQFGFVRARQPQVGDYWQGCDDARAAGTAPIYAGEPGYRDTMDGDGDGIACEPHR